MAARTSCFFLLAVVLALLYVYRRQYFRSFLLQLPKQYSLSCQLNGSNYLTWSRLMRTAVRAENKLGFVDNTIKELATVNLNKDHWSIVNSMIADWISNTLEKTLQLSIACIEDAKLLWDDLKRRSIELESDFDPNLCLIPDRTSRRMIGIGELTGWGSILGGVWRLLESLFMQRPLRSVMFSIEDLDIHLTEFTLREYP
ncbi:hypothetical protein CRG98_025474 [Punica granatum]|uniref:Retrotransposon Copia-like N-terminal domain-containing protein n=1 Tax=Punica granatum TaxID=22663 RepID=A0A2I0JD26_PUNGR|nr:hypothetical protein CRG98_025474 [Punica granatum]